MDIAAQSPANLSPTSLAPLREDLKLFPGARQPDGSPTWTLHDPVRHSFFKIGWLEFEILCRWHLGNAKEIFTKIGKETTLQLQSSHIEAVNKFLVTNCLLQKRDSADLYKQKKSADRKSLLSQLIKNYLYLKLPLFRPDNFLHKTLPAFQLIRHPLFLVFVAVAAFVGFYLTLRQWDSFQNTFLYFFTFSGAVNFAIALTFVKILHELGHAYTAKSYGLTIPTMGVALILFWPVLYTDTSDAWRLTARSKKLIIASAGIFTELTIAVLATFLWSFLPNGELKSVSFILATTTWITTIAVNLNPFMKFDGYYLLADFIDIPNLQQRSFTLGRWWLRRILLGLIEPCPENLPKQTQKIVLLYAFATWLYRIILFTGIALMIYHFAFKVVGIILMVLELVMFIALPIFRELKSWWFKRKTMQLTINLFCTLIVLLGFVIALLFPFPLTVEVPAVYKAKSFSRIYPPESARLEKILIQKGDVVKKGDLLFVFRSPALDFKENKAKIEVEKLRIKQQRINFISDQSDNITIVEQQLTRALTTLNGFKEQQELLHVTSTINGRVAEFDQSLQAGRWVNEKERLALIIDTSAFTVEGMMHEDNFRFIETGQAGQFYPEEIEVKPFPVQVLSVEEQGISTLSSPYLASTFGGPIPVHVKRNNLISPENYYRVFFSVSNKQSLPNHVLRGTVRLVGKSINIVQRAWPHVAEVFIRESGF